MDVVDDTDFDEEVKIPSFEVTVSRIKLRLRKKPNPNPNPKPNRTTAKFNFHYHRKHLVVDNDINGFDHIIAEHNYPKRSYTVSEYTPLPIRSALTAIISALLNITDTDTDPESLKVIAKHVHAFTRLYQRKNCHASVSIDIDIKVVSGSYSIGRDNNVIGWTDFEDAHRGFTHHWIVDDDDKDYHVVKCLDNTSYVIIPCGGRGDLKALRYDAAEVTRACTCSVCLVDFAPREEPVMNVLKMSCGHVFHRKCVVSWILSNDYAKPTCPLCRATMEFSNFESLD